MMSATRTTTRPAPCLGTRKKEKKEKRTKKERPTKPRLVLHWGREKLVETDVFISHADLYAKARRKELQA